MEDLKTLIMKTQYILNTQYYALFFILYTISLYINIYIYIILCILLFYVIFKLHLIGSTIMHTDEQLQQYNMPMFTKGLPQLVR